MNPSHCRNWYCVPKTRIRYFVSLKGNMVYDVVGACCNLIFCVFVLFLARFLFQSSFFSKSRLCTRPLFNHFVLNLDQLAGQPIQFFCSPIFLFCSRFFMYSSVGSILWVATVC